MYLDDSNTLITNSIHLKVFSYIKTIESNLRPLELKWQESFKLNPMF